MNHNGAAVLLFVGAVAAASVACGSGESTPTAESTGSNSEAIDTSVDLVSTATCHVRGTRFVGCTIGPRSLAGVPLTTAIPLRTTFTVNKSGNCSTATPLAVTFSAAGADNVRFPFLAGGTVAIRRKDGQPMPTVTMTDSSPWTSSILLDSSCAVSLNVVSNEPDVNSKADAQAILDQLTSDLNAKTVVRDHYQHLALYHSAFVFLQSVANNLLVELTNDTIQQLRLSANDSMAAISTLMGGCDTLLTDKDRQNLMTLFMSLPQLGQASDWQTDGGKPKTLADFLGPKQADVLATVQKLAKAAEVDGGSSTYETDYQNAARDVVVAQAKLDLAKKQLVMWLP